MIVMYVFIENSGNSHIMPVLGQFFHEADRHGIRGCAVRMLPAKVDYCAIPPVSMSLVSKGPILSSS